MSGNPGSSPRTESKDVPDFEWNPETEVHLFYALKSHKPVGVNRYFHMICIQELFNNLMNKEVPSKVLWDHLDKLYDMEALHENEDYPFPNHTVDFSLPSEYEDLKARKINLKSDDSCSSSKSNDSMSSSSSSSNATSNPSTLNEAVAANPST